MDGTEDSETFSKPFHLGISRTYLIKVIFVPKYFTQDSAFLNFASIMKVFFNNTSSHNLV